MKNLQVGTVGWLHPEWSESFYPDDMPPEWQLDYFANLYRVVLVPESQWLVWQEDDLEECADAVEGDFSFYLQVNDTISENKEKQIQKVQQGLGSLLKGVVVFSESTIPDAMIHGQPVSLVSQKLVLPGWQMESSGLVISGNPMGFLPELSADGKQQAQVLREFMLTLPDNISGAPFFIGGDSINMTQVQNLKTVGELLGF